MQTADRLLLPDGLLRGFLQAGIAAGYGTAQYEKTIQVIERFAMRAAVHLFLFQERQVLFSQRRNTGYEDGKYGVPSGHLEGGERVVAAAIREAEEELGIRIAPEDLTVVGVMHRKSNDERIDFFLTAYRWSGEIVNREPEKCGGLAWFPLDQMPETVIPYIAQALRNSVSGHWFDSFGWNL
jgi:8-oxo-dGTP diphosphatase